MIVARRFLLAALSAAVAVGSSGTTAYAQTDEQRAGARAAADAGLQAYDAKNWAVCKDFFGRAQSIIEAPPHLLYLARCSVQLGELVGGREAYLKVVREIIAPDKPKAFRDAQGTAETELAALEQRIPYLNINVTSGAGKTVNVKMDGVDVPPALVGVPHPVDPGTHNLEASAEGMAAASKSVTLQEGQHEDVTLELVGPATGPAAPAQSSPAPELPPVPPDKGQGGLPLRTIGFATMAVGVAGLVVGGVFFAQASGDTNSANSKYDQFHCLMFCPSDQQQQVKNLDNQAASAKTIAVVSGGAGIVALGAGVTLVLLPRHGVPKQQGLSLTPEFGIGSLGLRGAF
jgi:hypothetical protein